MSNWKIEHWEGNEYVITNETGIIGNSTLTKKRAESILLWLKETNL